MFLKKSLKMLLAALSGCLLGYLGWKAYWHIDIIPSAAWPSIVALPPVKTVHGISPEFVVPLIIAIKAMIPSTILGLIGGYLLPRFKFQRVYCYSVFLWPLLYFAIGYYVIRSIEANQWPNNYALWCSWNDHRIVAIAVYAWLFLGLYVGAVIARRRLKFQPNVQSASK